MARIAIISDVHANLPALEAVVKQLENEKPDLWLCLGDIVGYGPHPAECVELIKSRNMQCVLGNHDAGVVGKLELDHFRNPNRKLIEMTRQMISTEQMEWLGELPFTHEDTELNLLAVHSSPENPQKWEYLNSAFRVRQLLTSLSYNFCIAGHTHRPGVVSEAIGVNTVKKGYKFFINPGSVGQSRDGDERASCGILDTEQFTYKNIRVIYDLTPVLQDLEKLGFSLSEARRLMETRIG